jgi:hypothetical protein
MAEHQIKLRPVRVIPWDVGTDLSNRRNKLIIKKLKKSNWRFRKYNHYCDKNRLIGYLYHKGWILTLDIFEDGFAIFSIHEKPKRFQSLHDFDPLTINQQKTDIHIQLLGGKHPLSELLSQVMTLVWSCIPIRKRRDSASSNWENQGFSYVFSFFFINARAAVLRTQSFQEKLNACLFPIPVAEVSIDAEMDQTCTLVDHTTQDSQKNLDEFTIAQFPYRKIFFSWSTAIVAGAITSRIMLDFCRIMRELQHAWFAAYIADRHLDHIVNNLSNINRIEKLIDLDSRMSSVYREIGKFTSIPDSMATSIILKTYKVAAMQSGLDGLANSIQTKLQYIRNEISTRVEKRNWRGYRKIEFILTILTFIQAVSAYKSIEVSGGLSIVEIGVFGATIFILACFVLLR